MPALSEAGDLAVVESVSPGWMFVSGRTEIQVLRRRHGSWERSTVLSRSNGSWIGGVSLAALALSGDGRRLVFRWMEDLKDYNSTELRVLDLATGTQTTLGKGRGGRVLDEDRKETAAVVSQSGWFKAAYPAGSFDQVFPDSQKRCAAPGELKAAVEGRRDLVVSKPGIGTYRYPLKDLPGTEAWAWQASWPENAMSKDCGRGLIAVEEVLETKRPSFFYGSDAYDARMRIVEFGLDDR